MFNKIKVACYFATRNYYEYLLPAITSLYLNSSVDRIIVFIEDPENDFPYKLPDNVSMYNVSDQKYFLEDSPNYKTKWTYMTLMKVVLPYLCGEYDEILCLDVDTFVDKNIDDIWDINIDDYYYGAVKEMHKSAKDKIYFNCGVLLMNLKKLREERMAIQLINALNARKYNFCEQDCINELCKDKILEIPGDYNVTWFNSPPKEEKIIHFAAADKWDDTELYEKYMGKYKEMFS